MSWQGQIMMWEKRNLFWELLVKGFKFILGTIGEGLSFGSQ
jgi:hypothetical protein